MGAADLVLDSRYGEPRRTCTSATPTRLPLALRDTAYRALLNGSDLNFADGHRGRHRRRRGHPEMTERAYGPTLMADVIDCGRERGLRHYLYGSSRRPCGPRRRAGRAVPGRADRRRVPPFRPLTDAEADELVERAEDAKPDVFWVGIGTPRQDEFVAASWARLRCTVVPVGAAFDFHGVKAFALPAVQKLGLEWAYRLVTEPRRCGSGTRHKPVFVYGVLTDRWRR